MTAAPVFYSFRRCPYAIRARLALAVSGRIVELREVVLRDKAQEFLATSPSATVPCLKLDGQVLDESLDIMLWALEENDPGAWLAAENGNTSGMMDLIRIMDGPFKRHLDRYKYDTRFADVDRSEERAAASVHIRHLEDRLNRSPWLFGARSSLADYAILPFVRQFANTDRIWFDAQSWHSVGTWLEAFESSGLFQSVMPKWAKWEPGQAPVYFPGKG